MLTVEVSDTERQYGNFFVFGRDAGGTKKITFFDNLGKRVEEALIQEYFIACLTDDDELYATEFKNTDSFILVARGVTHFAINANGVVYVQNGCHVSQLNMNEKTITSLIATKEPVVSIVSTIERIHVMTDRNIYNFLLSATDAEPVTDLKTIVGSKQIKSISAGERHVVILTDDGQVYSNGSTTYGATGRNEVAQDPYNSCLEWGKVNIPERVTKIAAGRLFTLCITDEKIYSFGVNNYCMLGLRDTTTFSFNTPQIASLENVKGRILDVWCGGYNSAIQTSHGYYGVGTNRDQALFFTKDRAPDKWTLMDQPFLNGDAKFKIELGHCVSIAYVDYAQDKKIVFSSKSSLYCDIDIKC